MSPLYTVFRLTAQADGAYLSQYFKTSLWHAFMRLEGNSGARSDRFSIGDSVFFTMPLPVPSLPEQRAIGAFFSSVDDLIALHQRVRPVKIERGARKNYDGCFALGYVA